MPNSVIIVEGLSKSYLIRPASRSRYIAVRDNVRRMAGRFVRSISPFRAQAGNSYDRAWEEATVLSDVSFNVQQGERVAIIGRNGAGKSTLLKILSGHIKPTKGTVHIKGRVASLHEIRAGFQNRLTGRDNIFRYGATLGMRKAATKRKFEEIIAFAEMEQWLDLPVKDYSADRCVRLAMALAICFTADILVVEDILSLADAAFQEKCRQKMEELSKAEGRTIVVASSDVSMMKGLCNKAMLLIEGKISAFGAIDEILPRHPGPEIRVQGKDIAGSAMVAGRFFDPNYPPKNEIIISNFEGGIGREWVRQGQTGTAEDDTNPAHCKYGKRGIVMASANKKSVVIDKYNIDALSALKDNDHIRLAYFTTDFIYFASARLYFSEDSSFSTCFSANIHVSTPLNGWFEFCINKKEFIGTPGAAWERVRHARIVFTAKRWETAKVTMSTLRMFKQVGKPKVIITIDDGLESAYSQAYPFMKKNDLRATLFVNGSLIGTPGHMTLANLHELQDKGFDVASHSWCHANLATSPYEVIENDVRKNYEFLVGNGFKAARLFAHPYGAYGVFANHIVMQYHDFARGTLSRMAVVGESSPFITPWYLKIVQNGGEKPILECLDDVIAENAIGILLFHGFWDKKTEWTMTSLEDFAANV